MSKTLYQKISLFALSFFIVSTIAFIPSQVAQVSAAPNPPSAVSPTSKPKSNKNPAKSDIFGEIQAPQGVEEYNADPGAGASGIGIIVFISNLIKLATVVAGVWTFINIVLAGWVYINSSGDSKAHSEVSNKLIMSAIGLVIIAVSYTIAGLISYLIFGDPKFILQPTFEGLSK